MIARLLFYSIDVLLGALFGCIFGLVVSVLPLIVIEYHSTSFLRTQSFPQLAREALFIGSSTLLGGRAGLKYRLLKPTENTRIETPGAFSYLLTIFVFLYTACSQLCYKLHLATVPAHIISKENWICLGLFIASLGAATAFIGTFPRPATAPTNHRKYIFLLPVQHPIYLSLLLYLIGSTLIFTTWFPLLAIPGVFVSMLWHIRSSKIATVGDAGIIK